MFQFFEQLSTRIAAPFAGESKRNSKVWQCHCGQSVFFRNSQCLACSSALGYLPEQSKIAALEPGPEAQTWRLTDERQPRHGSRLQLGVSGAECRRFLHRL
jgi:hypothetical protein